MTHLNAKCLCSELFESNDIWEAFQCKQFKTKHILCKNKYWQGIKFGKLPRNHQV